MNSIVSTFSSVILNKFALTMIAIAFIFNMGLNYTEKWAVSLVPANAQEILDVQNCTSKDPNLQDIVEAYSAKPLSKVKAQEILESCPK